MRKLIAVASLLCTLFLTVGCSEQPTVTFHFTVPDYRITAFNPEAGTVEVRDENDNVYPIQISTNPSDVFGTDQTAWPVERITRQDDGRLKLEFTVRSYNVAALPSGETTLVLVRQSPATVRLETHVRRKKLLICDDFGINCSVVWLP